MLVLSGDTPLLTAELLRDARRRRTSAQERRRDGAQREPPDPRRYGRDRPRRRRAASRAIVEAHRRDAGGARDRRDELLDLRLPRRRALARARAAEPKNAQGELYLTDAIEILVAAGEKVAAHVAPDPDETDGVNTRVELAAAGRSAARPDQRGATCSPA